MYLYLLAVLAAPVHPPLTAVVVAAATLAVLLTLIIIATLVALFAGPARGERARLVLRELLTTLRHRTGRRR
ncbi:hypothetical protein [Nocardia sp. XZ_19_369]|uniref:hypothetical protein n=1 Tax=Nocardia sp. XZ_19_369 TaxID=2769487 RepID=UPI00188F22E6|nr:hypothetical protein [Nocardia sp. XZ_19_369]